MNNMPCHITDTRVPNDPQNEKCMTDREIDEYEAKLADAAFYAELEVEQKIASMLNRGGLYEYVDLGRPDQVVFQNYLARIVELRDATQWQKAECFDNLRESLIELTRECAA